MVHVHRNKKLNCYFKNVFVVYLYIYIPMPAGLKDTYNLSWIPWIYFEH